MGLFTRDFNIINVNLLIWNLWKWMRAKHNVTRLRQKGRNKDLYKKWGPFPKKNRNPLRPFMKWNEISGLEDIKQVLISLGGISKQLIKIRRGVSHASLGMHPNICHGTCDNSKMNILRDKINHKSYFATSKNCLPRLLYLSFFLHLWCTWTGKPFSAFLCLYDNSI